MIEPTWGGHQASTLVGHRSLKIATSIPGYITENIWLINPQVCTIYLTPLTDNCALIFFFFCFCFTRGF